MKKSVKVVLYGSVTALLFGVTPVWSQDFSGTISIDTSEDLDDNAEYERYTQLASVSLSDALDAAQGSAQGAPAKVELDEENGYLVWEVTFPEQTVVVDAGSAEVLTTSSEDADKDPSEAQVSLSDAAQTAQQEIGADTYPTNVELDDEDDSLVWEAEFGDREVTVDAASGEVLNVDD